MSDLNSELSKIKFEGFFEYEDDFPDSPYQVHFQLIVTVKDGVLKGTGWDDESTHLFNEPAVVNGFIKDNFVSFVKDYPCLYYKNEQQIMVVDKTKNHPSVNYRLDYSEKEQKWIGKWEMVVDEMILGDYDHLEEVYDGYCEMTIAGTA